MVIEEPFALFITWTCYGTWLPGDSRGHVSDTLQPGSASIPKNNAPQTEHSPGHEFTLKTAMQRQRFGTVKLTTEQARHLANNLLEVARKHDWRILRAAVMYNHIHLVITDCPDDGPGVRRILKGNSQAKLNHIYQETKRWWTRGGSNRYLHSEEAIRATIKYVAEQKGILSEIIDMDRSP
jgi:REP element-mobilizing transposase RayT